MSSVGSVRRFFLANGLPWTSSIERALADDGYDDVGLLKFIEREEWEALFAGERPPPRGVFERLRGEVVDVSDCAAGMFLPSNNAAGATGTNAVTGCAGRKRTALDLVDQGHAALSDEKRPRTHRRDDNNETNFDKYVVDLLAFQAEHGDGGAPDASSDRPLHNFTEGDLHGWMGRVNESRLKLESGEPTRLTRGHIAILDRAGFPWESVATAQRCDDVRGVDGVSPPVYVGSPPINDEKWAVHFHSLKEYRDEHGHCDVPSSVPSLGKWVGDMRHAYKRLQDGKKSHMTDERVRLLESVGFNWRVRPWDHFYEKLVAYAEDNDGDCDVPSDYELDPSLANWVQQQRRNKALKGTRGGRWTITDEQMKKLDDIGFKWNFHCKRKGEREKERLYWQTLSGTAYEKDGRVLHPQIRALVESSPAIVKMMEQNVDHLTDVVATILQQVHDSTRVTGSRYVRFEHLSDRKSRRVPPGWTIPGLNVRGMYVYWHCGNEASKISPIKNLDRDDLSHLGEAGVKKLRSLKSLMKTIDNGATFGGVPPKNSPMTEAEANACFAVGKDALNIPTTTPTGRARNVDKVSWESALKMMPKYKRLPMVCIEGNARDS